MKLMGFRGGCEHEGEKLHDGHMTPSRDRQHVAERSHGRGVSMISEGKNMFARQEQPGTGVSKRRVQCSGNEAL